MHNSIINHAHGEPPLFATITQSEGNIATCMYIFEGMLLGCSMYHKIFTNYLVN